MLNDNLSASSFTASELASRAPHAKKIAKHITNNPTSPTPSQEAAASFSSKQVITTKPLTPEHSKTSIVDRFSCFASENEVEEPVANQPCSNKNLYIALDKKVKAGELDEQSLGLAVTALNVKAAEFKINNKDGTYGVKLESEEDLVWFKATQEYNKQMLQARLDYLRRFFTTFDFETGETRVPDIPDADAVIGSSQKLELAHEEKIENDKRERNLDKLASASKLDFVATTSKMDAVGFQDSKTALVERARRVHVTKELATTTKALKDSKPEKREELIAALSTKLQSDYPDQNFSKGRVAQLLSSGQQA